MAKSGSMGSLTFGTLMKRYVSLQARVLSQIKNLASALSSIAPGKFLVLQFAMSQVAQIGESISNLVAQIQAMIALSVRNQKAS